jgi:trimeric autotransporter adhesin
MCATTTGASNVAVGTYSLDANTTGANNTAVGTNALTANTTGGGNTAFGSLALCAHTTSGSNTGIGRCSLKAVTTGGTNTAIGAETMSELTTGSGNVAIGIASGADTMINVSGSTSNRAVFGHNAITNSYVKVAFTVTSDARDKMNFESVPHGLDFVNQLQPYKFNFKKSREDDTPHGSARYGFKAQDILALEGDNNVIIDNENEDALKYNGEALVPVLVNAIKELKARIETLENN